LERLVVERNAVLPEFVYLQVLPSKGAVFAALEQLTSRDLQERRHAADRLADLASAAPLRPLVVAHLVELGTKEDDGLVWRGLFTALSNNPSDRAAALAYAGLSHRSPEVRRMACEHLGRSPNPGHAAALLDALDDPHVGVVIEAVRALGGPGMLAEAGPVEPLLQAGDSNLRFAAAETLHRNRLPQGAASIERLAYDRDPEIRRRAAVLMGKSGDAVFIPTLVDLSSDAAIGVRQASVDALPKLVGSDVSIRPGEPLPSLEDRAAAWRAWYARGR
jgi:HEAT repeat protein